MPKTLRSALAIGACTLTLGGCLQIEDYYHVGAGGLSVESKVIWEKGQLEEMAGAAGSGEAVEMLGTDELCPMVGKQKAEPGETPEMAALRTEQNAAGLRMGLVRTHASLDRESGDLVCSYQYPPKPLAETSTEDFAALFGSIEQQGGGAWEVRTTGGGATMSQVLKEITSDMGAEIPRPCEAGETPGECISHEEYRQMHGEPENHAGNVAMAEQIIKITLDAMLGSIEYRMHVTGEGTRPIEGQQGWIQTQAGWLWLGGIMDAFRSKPGFVVGD